MKKKSNIENIYDCFIGWARWWWSYGLRWFARRAWYSWSTWRTSVLLYFLFKICILWWVYV